MQTALFAILTALFRGMEDWKKLSTSKKSSPIAVPYKIPNMLSPT